MQTEKQTFSKEERLKSRKIINNLFEYGNIIHHYPFKVIYEFTKDKNLIFPAKIAISVSKKNFRRAVDRNYIKRKIREAYRRNKQLLYNKLSQYNQILYFFVIYTAKHDLDYSEIENEMINLIIKLKNKLE